MDAQDTALVKLLGDDDPDTVRLVKEQLVRAGPGALPKLSELLASDDAAVTARVKGVLLEIQGLAAESELIDFLRRFGDSDRLEQACWLIARAMVPGFDPQGYVRLLDAWGSTLSARIAGTRAPAERVAALRDLLCGELGFRGNSADYYNPANSILPAVIDTRLGIPISLSVLFMLVGMRAGIGVAGVNLPGHFIARHEDVLFDPFHEARLMSLAECTEIMTRQKVATHPHLLDPVRPRRILLRMLTNLLYIFEQRNDTGEKARIASWVRALEPTSPLGGI